MSKVKSAIITALVCLCTVALLFFAVVSFSYGSSGKRLNSVLSSISLGSEFTGDAESVIYPEGIVTQREYELYLPEDASSDEYAEYVEQYQPIADSELYYDTEEISSGELEEVKTRVAADAEVIASRLSGLGYSSYTVSVYNDYGIRIAVATGYTYADYVHDDYPNDDNSASAKLSTISSVLSVVTLDGELSLRNSGGPSDYDKYETGVNSLVNRTVDINSYFKKISSYSSGGTYAIKIKLTDDGQEALTNITTTIIGDEDTYTSQTIDFYVGGDELLSLSISEVMEEKTFYITVDSEDGAVCYAAVLDSVISGDVVELEYSSEISDGITVTAPYSANGRYAAIAAAVATLVLYIAAFVVLTIRYKKLGAVSGLSLLLYLLAIIYTVFLMGVELTAAGMILILTGGALLCVCNAAAFEDVRYFVKHGNVMHNAVKQGYKRHLGAILDIHIVLALVSLVLALALSGTIATYALVTLIATITSYALYWFTRFMWYVTVSPQKNKFAFCGFKREVVDDD